MWKAIPQKRRKQIKEQIWKMKNGLRKEILTLALVDGMSTTEVAEFAKTVTYLNSRNHRPISKRRIQQIIVEEIPDVYAYMDHSQREKPHRDHDRFAYYHKKERCAHCGSTERLEWHHMIPASVGGTAEEANMICLCHECHQIVTDYNRKIFPNELNGMKQKSEK